MSTTRLSSLSFQTLSSLLERQRLQSLGKTPPSTQLVTIKRNLEILREGIVELERQIASVRSEGKESTTADTTLAVEQLRTQWERARRMLGEEGADLENLPAIETPTAPEPSSYSDKLIPEPHIPYHDDPPRSPSPEFDPGEEMQSQRQIMETQDTRLDTLSGSIRRQREISENIGNELDVHTGLLEDLESGLDNTALNLGGARRLDTVARGAKENGSAVTIAVLIVVLLILIIVFKT